MLNTSCGIVDYSQAVRLVQKSNRNVFNGRMIALSVKTNSHSHRQDSQVAKSRTARNTIFFNCASTPLNNGDRSFDVLTTRRHYPNR